MRKNGPMGRLSGGSWHPAFTAHWPAVSARPPYPACADGEKWGGHSGRALPVYRNTGIAGAVDRW